MSTREIRQSLMEPPLSKEQQNLILAQKREECITGNTSLTTGYCPQVWDSILCWAEAPPGTLSSQHCPSYIAGFKTGNATKFCTDNGTWFWFNNSVVNNTWTNYTECLNGPTGTIVTPPSNEGNLTLIPKYLPTVKAISQIGYSVSLFTLIIAFIILASFKKLRCPRNILHMHLFISFILRAALSLLKNSLFVGGLGLASDIAVAVDGQYIHDEMTLNWSCKLLISLWQYFILANYSWILMEGLYLHNLIFLALFSDTSAITTYIILGWGLPLLCVIPWVIVRATLDDRLCWTAYSNHNYFLLIRIPITISILLNFGLFLNIVRVLLLKLTASISEEKRRFRRWAKSTLVLMPLFGVHYAIFLGMQYGFDEWVELIWLLCDTTFSSFQGFFVAVLYCFLNGEVQAEVLKRGRNQQQAYSMSEKSSMPIMGIFRNKKNRKRGGSTIESCMTSFISSVTTDPQRRMTLQSNDVNQLNESKMEASLLQKGSILKNDMDINN